MIPSCGCLRPWVPLISPVDGVHQLGNSWGDGLHDIERRRHDTVVDRVLIPLARSGWTSIRSKVSPGSEPMFENLAANPHAACSGVDRRARRSRKLADHIREYWDEPAMLRTLARDPRTGLQPKSFQKLRTCPLPSHLALPRP